MRKFLALAFFLICASAAHAQGAAYTAGPFNTSGPLYVCTTPVTTTPCSSFASLFSNAALSSAISNPFPMTAGVAITFYVTPGQYAVQMPNAGFSQIVTIGGGGGTASSSSTLNNNAWYLSQSCGAATNCTQIHGDLKYTLDGTSNSTTTFTCPECNFSAADVNKVFWATTLGSGIGSGQQLYTTYVCPITTIASVTNSTTIILNIACTASGAGNVVAYYGTRDGAALAALDAAVGCAVIHVPANIFILDDQPFLVNPPASGTCGGGTTLALGITAGLGQPAPSLVGDGASAPQAVFVWSPDFNYANCKAVSGASLNVCVGATARAIANVTFWGTGLTAASNSTGCASAANKIFVSGSPVASNNVGIVVAGICPGASAARGFEANSFDENFEIGAVISSGSIACAAHGVTAIVFRETDCRNDNVAGGLGMVIDAGAQAMDISSLPIQGVQVSGIYQTRGTHITSPASGTLCLEVKNGGVWLSYGDYVGVDGGVTATTCVQNDTGGQIQTLNTNYKASGVAIANSGTIISNGGNKSAVGFSSAAGAIWSGSGVLVGTCRGTATSSATLGLYGLGQFSTPACTSTTVNEGVAVSMVPLTGSVTALNVSAGTGCKSGNTCVFTVMKNNSANPSTPVATNLTCSMVGPASSCFDNTHFDVPVAGDTYSIQFTTGLTETLANVTATVVNW